jgi:hypothetical protein
VQRDSLLAARKKQVKENSRTLTSPSGVRSAMIRRPPFIGSGSYLLVHANKSSPAISIARAGIASFIRARTQRLATLRTPRAAPSRSAGSRVSISAVLARPTIRRVIFADPKSPRLATPSIDQVITHSVSEDALVAPPWPIVTRGVLKKRESVPSCICRQPTAYRRPTSSAAVTPSAASFHVQYSVDVFSIGRGDPTAVHEVQVGKPLTDNIETNPTGIVIFARMAAGPLQVPPEARVANLRPRPRR